MIDDDFDISDDDIIGESLKVEARKRTKPSSIKQLREHVEAISAANEKAVGDLNSKIDESNRKSEASFAEILKAINNPVSITKSFEADEQDLGDPGTADFQMTNGDLELVTPRVTDVSKPEFRDKMRMMEFNKELVKVHIQETQEINADQVFFIGVNGKQEIFKRGEIKVVKRMFVEGLARAKPIRYENKKITDENGDEKYVYPARAGLKYPFSVLEDKNPSGKAWLSHLLRQA